MNDTLNNDQSARGRVDLELDDFSVDDEIRELSNTRREMSVTRSAQLRVSIPTHNAPHDKVTGTRPLKTSFK